MPQIPQRRHRITAWRLSHGRDQIPRRCFVAFRAISAMPLARASPGKVFLSEITEVERRIQSLSFLFVDYEKENLARARAN